MRAMEVVIREPRIKWSDWVVRIFVGLAATFVSAWFVMILTPMVFGVEIGYGQALAFLVLVRLVFPRGEIPHLRTSEKQKESN